MKTIHLFLIFIVVAIIQLFVPTQMIFNREDILTTGVPYKFKTQPVDPNDPFRGKYITLSYEARTFKTFDSTWVRKEQIYVYIDVDDMGYAKIDTISRGLIPDYGNDYIKAEAGWYDNYSNNLDIEYPFNRYYMEETKAYDAEKAVRTRQRDSILNTTYALVYIKEGEAVLNDVIIDDISIKDYVEKEALHN